MSAESSVDAAAPALNLTPEEKRAYGQLFRQADSDNVGVVTGEVAVKFFEKTRLDSRVLGEIWQIADKENRGFLTPAGFGIVLRLIGHAQAGRDPTPELALQQGPLPRFDGININTNAPPPAHPPIQAQSSGSGPIRIPPLTPEKVSQYTVLFERQNLQPGGILPGDQAKNIFEKSGLPNEVLGRIWQLADTEQRGALVLTEFVIAMHLLTSMKSGALRGLPNILPAPLYEAATRRPGSAQRQSPAPTGPTISAIPRQLSGQAQARTTSPLGRPPLGPQATGVAPQVTGGDWLVTAADKIRFDQFYADLDKTNKGFITGEEAVPFLSQSGLPEDALAQIWDLADINSEGKLNRDTFAVAMYLIRQQRSRRDIPLPVSLPPNLIPPSIRNQARPPVSPSPFDAPAPSPPPVPQPAPQPKSAIDDLFGLDAAPSPAPPQIPASTGGSATRDPFASGPPTSPVRTSPTANTFKPFVPSSSFGKTLTSHDTGGSSGSAQRGPPPPSASAMEDLLGDNDPEVSKKLTNETTELANLSNQVGSLSKQMQQVQGQRNSTQNEINQASEQKRNFEARLSQLRALYEKEAQDVRSLEEQLRNVREETKKLTNELITIDGTYKDLQSQHQQLSQALQADQQENTSLKQRISSVNTEIAQLKPQIEKLKSEARQQKGMVAINKKQLSTTEGDRDKLKTEVEDLTKSNDELSRQINTGSPVATSAQVSSPAPSTTSANNPFFRRTGSTDIMGTFTSPPAKSYGERSFNDIFGDFGGESTSSPPITSFKHQDTGTSTASIGSFATPSSSTPTVSRQPTFAEPQSSTESHQQSPSFAPFGEASETLAPSRQVSPPVSRAGESTATPSASASTPVPIDSASTGQSLASNSDTNQKRPSTQGEDKPRNTGDGSIPGSFPDETPTAPAPTTPYANNRDSDLFGNLKDSGNAQVDFDSAFASINNTGKPQDKSTKDNSNAFSTFNSEFPPISELERDDESDSASEGNRFDDDFAPASPGDRKTEPKEAHQAPASPTASKSSAAAVNDNSAAEIATTSSHASHPSNDLSVFPEPPKASPSFSSPKTAGSFAPTPTTVTNSAPVAPKGAFDDDDDFADLEDAKEGSADDEFANLSRSNLDDFNPVFDSSPPPSQPKSESTNVSNAFGIDSSYDFGTVSSTSAATASQAPTNNNANTSSFSSQAPAPSNNQDWEALFASLDSPNDTSAKTGSDDNKSPVQSQNSGRPGTAGRALSDEGKHDDPIVNLTGMGYSRTDAVNALEKYDYNLERAANYLANQS
ncbi:uncharacterized protein F4822DRAFT_252166 [Hypoxylon trugodes]|uniref:uncharacterized protein n=1 Tax=Hypoxylon trugodes TaxID=326681 RepID=UPI00218CE090|nr:uncharacterized protein F4822DRAFT_252166 [Hypoxylon trugodes]KAI1388639.1 hypothetical protein F4822DRAFT_252166 [Hypoxylon trugodes]